MKINLLMDVTKQCGPNYFPPAERIATFDNDGTLDKALDQAEANGWIIVDMKNDWKRIFAFEKVK